MRPGVALALATISFVTLVIFGFGMLSLAADVDVIAVPGLGQVPGIVATTAATIAFAGSLWPIVRRPQPSYGGSAITALAGFLAYVIGLWVAAVAGGADLARAGAAAAGFATSGFALVLAGAGLVAGWGGIALVRTRARRPRWPWEDEFDQ
ncbi:hypothetical protein HQM25_03005 [Microbacterium hominis]|uniref:Uncharacterized protein n=1 Tax=Microbacterium hominis TaxID=162426 RepID=A0A7D4QA82_9MICO|nr:hypothetical protein HQM25_03005 [Microbacterium hominis]